MILQLSNTSIFLLYALIIGNSQINSFPIRTSKNNKYSLSGINIKTQSKIIPSSSSLNFFKFNSPPEPKEEKKEEEVKDNAYDEADPVEKIFSFFFGKREEEPMGMSRFGPEKFPELYEGTKTEFAEPVDGDEKEFAAVIRPLMKNTNLETRNVACVYDANKHGWDAYKFHAKVDKKGPSIVVCKTRSGKICGGYNPKGWVGYGEARGSKAAFLFTKPSANVDTIKLLKVGGPSLAQIDNPENGPSFGADSLVIPLDGTSRNSKLARSKLGSYYERMSDGTTTLFGDEGANVLLKELKVYQGVYEEGEFIPFTDAEPFALY